MHRDLATRPDSALATFDVLVVGGGIYGLTIAYDCAQRGLSVALIERDDFGSGASFNHLRTIHGGLRYLQSLDIGRARESVRERRTIARIAPHAVRSTAVRPAALPLADARQAGDARRLRARSPRRVRPQPRRAAVASAAGRPRRLALRRGRSAFRASACQGLTGAAVFYDYVTHRTRSPDVFASRSPRPEHGAVLANHVEAMAPRRRRRARDRRQGARRARAARALEIAARLTINATGGGVDGC